MSIEELLPVALLRASAVRPTSFANRQGIYHVGYFAEFPDGGRINVSTQQRVATEHASFELSDDGERRLKEFVAVSTFSDVIVSSLRFPGDKRPTFSPTEEDVLDFLRGY